MNKKIIFTLLIIFSGLFLTSCNKYSNYKAKNINKIEVFTNKEILVYYIEDELINDFVNDFNELEYVSHSGVINAQYEYYILFSYDKYNTKVTPYVTYRIDENNNISRNRNIQFNLEEFNALILKYELVINK